MRSSTDDGGLEMVDRRQVGLDRAAKAARECCLLGVDDFLLQRQRLALARGGVPVPRLPLELHAAQPVPFGLVADEIEARPPVSAPAIGRQLRAIGGLGERLLTRCPVARAIELRVLRPRPLARQRLARLRHRRVQIGQLRRCVGIDGVARERFQPAQRGAAVRAQRIGLLALLEQGRLDGGGISRDGRAFAGRGRSLRAGAPRNRQSSHRGRRSAPAAGPRRRTRRSRPAAA